MEPGAGGARRRGERHRPQAGRLGALERRLECARHDALVAVDVERDHGTLAQAEHGHAAFDRVVGRGRRQHGERAVHTLAPGVRRRGRPGREQARQVGQRAAVREHPAGLGVPPDPLGHQVDDGGLDRARRRAHLVDRHRLVDGAVDQVGHGRRDVGRGDLVCELAGMVQARGSLEHARPATARRSPRRGPRRGSGGAGRAPPRPRASGGAETAGPSPAWLRATYSDTAATAIPAARSYSLGSNISARRNPLRAWRGPRATRPSARSRSSARVRARCGRGRCPAAPRTRPRSRSR